MNEALTKREQFAIRIFAGLVADFDPETKANGAFIPCTLAPLLAESAVQLADALIKELDKTPTYDGSRH